MNANGKKPLVMKSEVYWLFDGCFSAEFSHPNSKGIKLEDRLRFLRHRLHPKPRVEKELVRHSRDEADCKDSIQP